MAADLNRSMAPVASPNVKRVVVDVRQAPAAAQVVVVAHFPQRRRRFLNQDPKHSGRPAVTAQMLGGDLILALARRTIDHRKGVGLAPGSQATEAPRQTDQMGIV